MEIAAYGIGDFFVNMARIGAINPSIFTYFFDGNSKVQGNRDLEGKNIQIRNPIEIMNLDIDFILIFSQYCDQEIYDNLIDMGINDKNIIRYSSFKHFTKYEDMGKWKRLNEQEDICIACNWYENDSNVETLICIKNNIENELRVKGCLVYTRKSYNTIIITRMKSSKKIIEKEFVGKFDISIPIESNEEVYKVTIDTHNIPHTLLDITKKQSPGGIVNNIDNEKIARNFRKIYEQQNTNFSMHEEDYLLLKNFRKIENCTIVDVGANYGQSILSFLRATDYMKIISFEADPNLK
ncbi:MAG: hypothetical protein ACYDG2_17415, partial [Ruminiclostridium sp.]